MRDASQDHGSLLRNYTQNIDTLENVVGVTRVVQCHGSFATATCTGCGHQVDCDAIRDEIIESVRLETLLLARVCKAKGKGEHHP